MSAKNAGCFIRSVFPTHNQNSQNVTGTFWLYRTTEPECCTPRCVEWELKTGEGEAANPGVSVLRGGILVLTSGTSSRVETNVCIVYNE